MISQVFPLCSSRQIQNDYAEGHLHAEGNMHHMNYVSFLFLLIVEELLELHSTNDVKEKFEKANLMD